MISAVEAWSKRQLGLEPQAGPERLLEKQLGRAMETAQYALARSGYYRKQYGGRLPGDFFSLPVVAPRDYASLWCEPQSRISRIVTLQTSGSTGTPKRIAFSELDLEQTLDFFAVGLGQLLGKGQRALCLLPGTAPNGVTDLIRRALERLGAACDHEEDPDLVQGEYDGIVAMPGQALRLLRTGRVRVKRMLLSADYIPQSLRNTLIQAGIEVYSHYGMTETCYGGGVTCACQDGYHMRDGQLLTEILDPDTLMPVAEGEAGEVVLTSLYPGATPLIRYRTGDLALRAMNDCTCGGSAPRLARILGRRESTVRLGKGYLSIHSLDEAMFGFPIRDYRAVLGKGRLRLTIDGPRLEEDQVLARLFAQAGGYFPVELEYAALAANANKRRIWSEQ